MHVSSKNLVRTYTKFNKHELIHLENIELHMYLQFSFVLLITVLGVFSKNSRCIMPLIFIFWEGGGLQLVSDLIVI